jgi:hypothetical protein
MALLVYIHDTLRMYEILTLFNEFFQDDMKNYAKPSMMFEYDDILSIDSGNHVTDPPTATASSHNLIEDRCVEHSRYK